MLDSSCIETRYAKSGELNIAYQAFGHGDVDLVLIPGWASNVENLWSLRKFAVFADQLAQFARVILLDRRGTGLSDPVANSPTLEERMDDVRAVIDAVAMRILAQVERMALSPGTARELFMLLTRTDVRHVLPVIRVPTIILHRKGDKSVRVEHARFLAQRIAGAKFVELPGDDHLPWVGDADTLLGEVREFLTPPPFVPRRALFLLCWSVLRL